MTTGEITLVRFNGEIPEVIINPAMKPVSAAALVRAMTMSGVTAAKIIRIQTVRESPSLRFDQEGGGQFTP